MHVHDSSFLVREDRSLCAFNRPSIDCTLKGADTICYSGSILPAVSSSLNCENIYQYHQGHELAAGALKPATKYEAYVPLWGGWIPFETTCSCTLNEKTGKPILFRATQGATRVTFRYVGVIARICSVEKKCFVSSFSFRECSLVFRPLLMVVSLRLCDDILFLEIFA